MIPAELEYLFILVVLGAAGSSIFSATLLKVLRRLGFWSGLSVFTAACSVLDYFAIRRGWWIFNTDKVSGLYFSIIPVEEFALFVFIFTATVVLWEHLGNGLD